MQYQWEEAFEQYVSKERIRDLRQLVNSINRRGRMIKMSVIMIAILLNALVLSLIGILDILKQEMDSRIAVINGMVALELAIVTFLSPIKGVRLTKEEVNEKVGIAVTADIMERIRKTAEEGASGIEKGLALIGGCATFITVILKVAS